MSTTDDTNAARRGSGSNDLLAGPWVCRRMTTHYAIEAKVGNGTVRVAEVRYVGRPDGSTSEREAQAIAGLPELVAAAEALLHEDGYGRTVFDTSASQRLWAALSAVRGRPVTPKPREW